MFFNVTPAQSLLNCGNLRFPTTRLDCDSDDALCSGRQLEPGIVFATTSFDDPHCFAWENRLRGWPTRYLNSFIFHLFLRFDPIICPNYGNTSSDRLTWWVGEEVGVHASTNPDVFSQWKWRFKFPFSNVNRISFTRESNIVLMEAIFILISFRNTRFDEEDN